MGVKKLLEMGFYVFPLRPGTKFPYKHFHWKDLSSNALRKILMWQRRYKNCNWAVDTGKSGLVVVDIDNKNEKKGSDCLEALEKQYGTLKDTYTVETPTGGLHAYFKGAARCSVDKIGLGLDIRSVGGYVVSEFSKIDGVAYESIFETEVIKPEKWLVGLAGAPSSLKKSREDIGIELDLSANVMRAVDYLNSVEGAVKGSGGDAYTYKVACKVRDFGVSEDTAVLLMLDHWYEKCNPNSKEGFVVRKVANAYNYAQEPTGVNTPEAVFDDIPGIKNKDAILSKDNNDSTDSKTTQDTKGITAEVNAETLMERWGLNDIIVPVHLFHEVQFPPKDHFLYPWVTSQTISIVYGDPGTGKTWFALAVAHAITTGSDFGPWQYRRSARTLYLDAEMTGVDIQYRLQHMNLLSAKNFFIYSDALGNLRQKPKANIMNKTWRDAVKAMLLKHNIEFWIADNLSSLTPSGDENTKEDWNPINQWLLDLRFHGISTLLLHHTNKSGQQRGTSARLDNIDFSLRLVKPKDYKEGEGARFNVIMEKGRIDHRDIGRMLDVQMTKTVDEKTGLCDWKFGKPENLKLVQVLHNMGVVGLGSKETAENMGITATSVSQMLRKLKSLRYLDRENRVSDMGRSYLEMKGAYLREAGYDTGYETDFDVEAKTKLEMEEGEDDGEEDEEGEEGEEDK